MSTHDIYESDDSDTDTGTLRLSQLYTRKNKRSASTTAKSKKVKYTVDMTIDEQLESVVSKVDKMETALRCLSDEYNEKQKNHGRELEKLKNEIERFRLTSENELAVQEARQTDEFVNLHTKLEQQIHQYQTTFDHGVSEIENFASQTTEFARISKAWKITDMIRTLEFERNRVNEETMAFNLRLAEKELQVKIEDRDNYLKMKQLEREVSQLQQTWRNIKMQARVSEAEMTTKLSLTKQNHTLALEKLKDEINTREKDYALHIAETKNLINHERSLSDKKLSDSGDRALSLQKIYKSLTSRGNQQLNKIMRNINKLQNSLNEAHTSEGRFSELNKSADQRTEILKSRCSELKATVKDLEAEKHSILTDNESIVSQLQQLYSPVKKINIRNASQMRFV